MEKQLLLLYAHCVKAGHNFRLDIFADLHLYIRAVNFPALRGSRLPRHFFHSLPLFRQAYKILEVEVQQWA